MPMLTRIRMSSVRLRTATHVHSTPRMTGPPPGHRALVLGGVELGSLEVLCADGREWASCGAAGRSRATDGSAVAIPKTTKRPRTRATLRPIGVGCPAGENQRRLLMAHDATTVIVPVMKPVFCIE